MADSDDDEVENIPHRAMTLSVVLGNVLNNEEMEGLVEQQNTTDGEIAGIINDMLGDVRLTDRRNDDDDLAQLMSNVRLSTQAEANGRRLLKNERMEAILKRQLHLESVRQAFGLSASVRMNEIDISEIPPKHAWLTDPKWYTLMSETGRVHDAVRRCIDYSASAELPQMGQGHVYAVPNTIESIRLPPWVCYTPLLRASNTVSTIHTNCEPDQERLATNHNSTTYNPNSFAANKIKRGATGLFFRAGAGVIAGPKGQQASSNECLDFVRFLQRMDMMPFEPTCKLQNIVSNASCFPIDLNLLARAYPSNSRYEVTRFPGLVFRFGAGKPWVFIIFPSGNVIGTGFCSWVDENLAWLWLFCYVLVQFKDSKDVARETAAEKKNRTFNDESVFCSTTKQILRVGMKRTLSAISTGHRHSSDDAFETAWDHEDDQLWRQLLEPE